MSEHVETARQRAHELLVALVQAGVSQVKPSGAQRPGDGAAEDIRKRLEPVYSELVQMYLAQPDQK